MLSKEEKRIGCRGPKMEIFTSLTEKTFAKFLSLFIGIRQVDAYNLLDTSISSDHQQYANVSFFSNKLQTDMLHMEALSGMAMPHLLLSCTSENTYSFF